MKQKIIKLLEQNSRDGWNEMTEVIACYEFEDLAEKLVKLFAIPSVIVPKGTLICEFCASNNVMEKYWTHECKDCGQSIKAN